MDAADATAARPPIPVFEDTTTRPAETSAGGGLLRSTPVFVLAYLAFMVPTYVLPWFGSNSALVGAFSAALGLGPSPFWWLHLWSLGTLCLMAWTRGAIVGRGWLPVFPVIAAFFDMTPGVNVIPLVPTVMHIVAIILGVVSGPGGTSDAVARISRRAWRTFWVLSALALAGISFFFVRTWLAGSARSAAKPPPAEIISDEPPPVPRPAPAKPATPPEAPKAAAPAAAPTPSAGSPSSTPAQQPISAPAPPRAAPAPAKPAREGHIPPKDTGTRRSVEQAQTASAAVAGMLEDAEACMGRKQYDCAIASAKAALRVAPGNANATAILRRAEAEQKRALEGIAIQ
ncbi:MAG: hypothetical protein AB1768_18655 [Pseudomonadota bacterium]